MPILINYQACDGSPDCPPIKWCTSAALSYDPDEKKVKYDREKCSNCGTCANWCGPGAIYFVETDEDLEFLRKEMGL
ncbi:hypothetical protein SY88_19750 [Clostridiales bacterium PH28_bin88]|nr:hypothetical protein SY88_19750 [Clostridiales bacterium PH28_bin88]